MSKNPAPFTCWFPARSWKSRACVLSPNLLSFCQLCLTSHSITSIATEHTEYVALVFTYRNWGGFLLHPCGHWFGILKWRSSRKKQWHTGEAMPSECGQSEFFALLFYSPTFGFDFIGVAVQAIIYVDLICNNLRPSGHLVVLISFSVIYLLWWHLNK